MPKTKTREKDAFSQLFDEVYTVAVGEGEPDIDLCISIAKKKRELSILTEAGYSYAIEAAVKCLAALGWEVERCRAGSK